MPEAAMLSTKRALLVLSHAMERAFETDTSEAFREDEPGFVFALFQRREYFEAEAARYAALAAAGHTVVVGFCGPIDGIPAGVVAFSLLEKDFRAHEWGLLLVRGAYATALHARDTHDLSVGEMTLQGSRLFEAEWTFDRNNVLQEARDQLDRLSQDIDAETLAKATLCVNRSATNLVSRGESRLAAAADHLVTSIEIGQRRLTRLRTKLEDVQLLAERDQLTGLNNRHFLERFLGSDDRPTDLLALLVDVDDLKLVNDREGHEAGDAVLKAVASGLRDNTRIGDVVIRWGGDEFLLLLPRIQTGEGLIVGEKLAKAIRSRRLKTPWEHITPSVSIGVCWARRTSLPIQQLDEALYSVKSSGKGHAALYPGRASADAIGERGT
jgi:diguanylate cyclase (GGDEF)-like protein